MCRLGKIYDFVYYEFNEPVMTHEENVMLDQHSLSLSLVWYRIGGGKLIVL
jgi:hypothetical protein